MLAEGEVEVIAEKLAGMPDAPEVQDDTVKLLLKIVRIREKSLWWFHECEPCEIVDNAKHENIIRILNRTATSLIKARQKWKTARNKRLGMF